MEFGIFRERLSRILRKDITWGIVLFCCLFLLCFKFLNLWFIQDDTSSIYGSTQKVWKLFSDRDTYLLFNRTFYTPLLPISFKPDFALFGFNPVGYHVHNLLLAFFTGIAGYKLLRLSLPRLESWVAVYLFLLSYPIVTMVGWLSMRHYLWGMLSALLSVYFFKRQETETGVPLSLISYLFFTLAILCKEAFATMPAMFLVLGGGGVLTRVRKTLPYVVLAGLFFLFRWHMIGGMGGYIEAKVDMSAIHFMHRLKTYLEYFSLSVWGVHAIVMLPFLLCLPKPGISALGKSVALSFLAMFPFLFVEPKPIPGFLHYFPARFIVPQFIAAFAFSAILLRMKEKRFRAVGYSVISIILLLQIAHAQSTFTFNKQTADQYKTFMGGMLAKNIEKKNTLMLYGDGIFYNFYYEDYRKLFGGNNDMGSVITLSTPQDIILVSQEELRRFDCLYIDGKWIDLTREKVPFPPPVINSALPPPRVRILQDGQFFTLKVDDDRDGQIYGVLKTSFSERNISLQAAFLPKKVNFKIGLVRGKETGYLFFCNRGECSRPIILDPGR